jgi:4-amino-4-deoxy-L-arabinose transferase-like glycosyltransferase
VAAGTLTAAGYPARASQARARLVALWCCLALTPIWLVTLFHRGLWTPDEPREADISWRMSIQQDRAIPTLAGQPFLEKPPLAYWAAAAATTLLPGHVAALRAPNLLFAFTATIAIAMLAVAGGGNLAAWIAALASGSFLLALQVASWLATDAAMMTGVACALLGFYRGLQAPAGRRKLAWYALMHTALAWAFLAKGPAAWLVPVSAALSLIAFERNWSALKRWELWAPAVIPLGAILAWLLAARRAPGGMHDLAVLLWYNVAGRAVGLKELAAETYSQGHHNWPGKYFAEYPWYLAPWTLLFAAALRGAWFAARRPDARIWRFALCAWAVPLLALSFASTARGIYAAPTLPAAALLIGLWFAEAEARLDRFDRAMLAATYWLVAFLAFVLFAACVLVEVSAPSLWAHAPVLLAGLVVTLTALLKARRYARQAAWRPFLAAVFGAFAISFVASGWVLFPAIDALQDIGSVMHQIDRDAGARPLALFAPDETTVALTDLDAPQHRGRWHIVSNAAEHAALVHDTGPAVLLVLLPRHAEGPLSRTLRACGVKVPPPPPAPILHQLEEQLGLAVERVYQVPGGRRYALLAPRVSATLAPSAGSRS